MVEADLPFSWRTANHLMRIAEHPVLTDSNHGSNLPNSWRTLSELAKLPEAVLLDAIDDGRITPDTQRKDIPSLLTRDPPRRKPRGSVATELTDLIKAHKKFSTLYIDPPWTYDNTASYGAVEDQYRTMTLEEIAALPIKELASDNAHLHLWTTNAFLFECPALFSAWDFEYKSVLIWVKPHLGLGKYWRVDHEFLLFGRRGNYPFRDHNQPSWFHADRREHSEKPEDARTMIEAVSPPPYLELFARKRVRGWTVWGDEIE